MKTFTITYKQIQQIHNAMCFLNMGDLPRAVDYLKPVRDDLMKAYDYHQDSIREQADRFAKAKNFKYTRWSIYEPLALINSSNVPAGATIVAPWETKESVVVEGYKGAVSWIELWEAVEKLARATKWSDGEIGFGDHVFIEGFHPVEGKENTYEVSLGS